MITKKHSYSADPLIIPRVKQVNYKMHAADAEIKFVQLFSQYLEDNVHQTYVDVGEMAKTLQERHREYQRRKVDMFRNQVEQGTH